jgi:O-antigen/teichoic acid export membrane protein
MIRDLSFVGVAFLYANAVGYIFHFFVSRHLGTYGYGEFMVIYSLMLSVGNFINLFSNSLVKELLKSGQGMKSELSYLRCLGLLLGFFILMLGMAFAEPVKDFLRISKAQYFWIVAGIWFIQLLLVIERAYLQSLERFSLLAFSVFIEQSVKLLAVFFLINLGVFGVLLSFFVSMFSTFGLVLSINRAFFVGLKRVSILSLVKSSLFTSPVVFFVYADDLFIRRIFDPHTAGLYASVSLVGKVFIWLIITLMSVLFPRFVMYAQKREKVGSLLRRALFWCFFVFIVFEVSLIFVGKYLFVLLFSEKFLTAFTYLPFYLSAVLFLTFTLIFIYLLTAFGKHIWLPYLHLFLYYGGFLSLDFKNVWWYIFYIFSINLCFLPLYALSIRNR